jgi:large subunit ribosomal protein L25
MSEKHSLSVQRRSVTGKHVKHLRTQGLLPATVYGKGVDPVSIQLDERTFFNVYRRVGHTSLVDLQIEGEKKQQSAFVHVVQRHPVTRAIVHADFRVVDLKVAINAEVPLHLIGESPLVERGDAVVNQMLQMLEVHALPANIPSSIEIDVSGLDSLDKSIYVRDLAEGKDYEIITDNEEVIVSLTEVRARRTEEEEEEEAAEAAEPELIRREQEEGTASGE